MKKVFPLIFLLFISFLYWGCGKAVEESQPTTPIANAGADQAVFLNLQCQLDGSASSGNLADYLWKVKSVPAGASPAITSADSKKAYFTPTSLGTYEFELELSNALGISTDAVAVTVRSFIAPSVEAGFFGVCAHLQAEDGDDLNQVTQMMEQAGVQFVRFDFDWKDIEPDDDEFAYSKYDAIVAKLKQKGIKALGILDYGNTWSDPTTGDADEINRFADYAYNTVKHFKGDVKLWQIWNEPNNETFWVNPSAANYTKLLKAAYGAVKQADPGAVVVLGGLVGNGKDEVYMYGMRFAAANFFSGIYSSGGKNYFDVAAIHPYTFAMDISSSASLEAAINDAKGIMTGNGDSKELWLTELGPLFFPPEPTPYISPSRGYTEAEVATWLNLIFTGLAGKCEKLFWYEFRDYPGATTLLNPNWLGLVKSDYTTKEAYAAYKNLPK